VKDVAKGKDRARGGHPGVVKLFWAFQDENSLCEFDFFLSFELRMRAKDPIFLTSHLSLSLLLSRLRTGFGSQWRDPFFDPSGEQ